MAASLHEQAATSAMADAHPECCESSAEHAQTCHLLPALLPTTALADASPAMSGDVFCAANLRLTGLEPSGPLDPPRIL